jgi:hypothetical protein
MKHNKSNSQLCQLTSWSVLALTSAERHELKYSYTTTFMQLVTKFVYECGPLNGLFFTPVPN